ncbi:unnamed protein product [Strongylus vulgaris]|uniref:Uncharacterized protein n=1 Tax=Strongylus vulgaris TaxID=40348 RepID=A0A3P7LGI2_STRVU|nr:unnamed protein product [Strongylus vulgaris]
MIAKYHSTSVGNFTVQSSTNFRHDMNSGYFLVNFYMDSFQLYVLLLLALICSTTLSARGPPQENSNRRGQPPMDGRNGQNAPPTGGRGGPGRGPKGGPQQQAQKQ